jgi:hypothetical protein
VVHSRVISQALVQQAAKPLLILRVYLGYSPGTRFIEHLCYNPPKVKSPEAGGGNSRPHNLDLSSLRKSPEQRPADWGVKKPGGEFQHAPKSGEFQLPQQQSEGVVGGDPFRPSFAEQKDRERLGKPPPEEVGEDEPTAKTPEQMSDPNREAFERFLYRGPMGPAVFGGHVRPSRRRKDEDSQPKP